MFVGVLSLLEDQLRLYLHVKNNLAFRPESNCPDLDCAMTGNDFPHRF